MRTRSLLNETFHRLRSDGPLVVVGLVLRFMLRRPYRRLRFAVQPFGNWPETFSFGGRSYPYFRHPYNYSWNNERALEVALARAAIEGIRPGDVLEVGNVLYHYGVRGHHVVDKYEWARGVENVDVVDYRPSRRFARVLCISTLEHVGWDESPREPEKLMAALRHMQGLVEENGSLFVTMPIGHNQFLDDHLRRHGSLPSMKTRFAIRVGPRNEWREADAEEALKCKYDHPYKWGNAIVVAESDPAPLPPARP